MTRYLLTPDRPVLLRPDGSVQLGWDPQRAVLVAPPDGIAPTHLADLLQALQDGLGRAELIAEAARSGLPEVGLWRLVDALTAAGLIHVETPRTTRSASIRVHGRGPLSELLQNALHCSGARVRHSTKPYAAAIPAHTDLVVLADYLVTDPRVVRELHRAGVAHLPVRVRDGTGLVGPLVLPGVTSCLQCADLHRSDRDGDWPAVAAQLRGKVGTASRATILATAALALSQIDLVIRAVGHRGDTDPAPEAPPTLDTTLEVDAGGCSVSARRWTRHPGCRC